MVIAEETQGTFERTRGIQEQPAGQALWFVVSGARVLMRQATDAPVLSPPRAAGAHELGLDLTDILYIGTLDGTPCMAARLDAERAPEGYVARDLRALYGQVSDTVWGIAGLASQLVYWAQTTRYCPRTGDRTQPKEGEWATVCPTCELTQYPRVSPCIIVLVHDGDRMLLTRQASWPGAFYSLVAGFVEPGETLEECVAREVREETGVEIAPPVYAGSQPWPFPHQLMVGFTAQYAGGEVVIDRSELEDAAWFPLDGLPMRPPSMSIAGRIIERYLVERAAPASL